MTLQELESSPNWILTVERTRNGVFDCLMRNIHGGYYWYTPNYQGLFAYGATSTYNEKFLQSCIETKLLRIVKEHAPN
jgi:hypothetical protein